jgi:hypothetical protein
MLKTLKIDPFFVLIGLFIGVFLIYIKTQPAVVTRRRVKKLKSEVDI